MRTSRTKSNYLLLFRGTNSPGKAARHKDGFVSLDGVIENQMVNLDLVDTHQFKNGVVVLTYVSEQSKGKENE
jgi:hypothetical protein